MSGAWRELDDGRTCASRARSSRAATIGGSVSRMDLGSIDGRSRRSSAGAAAGRVERVTALHLARLALRDGGIEIDDCARLSDRCVQRAEPAVWAAPQAEPDEPTDAAEAEQALELEASRAGAGGRARRREPGGRARTGAGGRSRHGAQGEARTGAGGGLEQEPANELDRNPRRARGPLGARDRARARAARDTRLRPARTLDDEPGGGQGNGPRAGSESDAPTTARPRSSSRRKAAAGEPRRSGGSTRRGPGGHCSPIWSSPGSALSRRSAAPTQSS